MINRNRLLDQLHHLIHEMELLAPRISRISAETLEARPSEDEPSVKELLGSLIAADNEVWTVLKDTSASTKDPSSPTGEENWREWEVDDLLERVQAERKKVIEAFEPLPEEAWKEEAEKIIHRDTERLRAISRRLYESNVIR